MLLNATSSSGWKVNNPHALARSTHTAALRCDAARRYCSFRPNSSQRMQPRAILPRP